jgi:hypothetical protein
MHARKRMVSMMIASEYSLIRLKIHRKAIKKKSARKFELKKSKMVSSGYSWLGHGIIASLAKRIATQNPPDGKAQTFHYTMLFNSFYRIFGACRREPATIRHIRRYGSFIKNDESDHNLFNARHHEQIYQLFSADIAPTKESPYIHRLLWKALR